MTAMFRNFSNFSTSDAISLTSNGGERSPTMITRMLRSVKGRKRSSNDVNAAGGSNTSAATSIIDTGEAIRIYDPHEFCETLNMRVEQGFVHKLLAKIQSIYGQMNLDGMMDVGFCFGLLDPVTNIIVGTAIAEAMPAPVRLVGRQAWYHSLINNLEVRSLAGLITFLTCLFPYLPDYKAVRYLDLADADPLVAARLIIKDRGMENTFGYTSDTTVSAVQTALRCAATTADHPSPDQFVSGWSLLSTCLAGVLSSSGPNTSCPRHYNIRYYTSKLLAKRKLEPDASSLDLLHLKDSWDFALSRLQPDRPRLFPGRFTMEHALLTTIHGFYLRALDRLPKDELQSRYHYSMLRAGHCYGPFDPVSNIILNTIWCEAAFPVSKSKRRVVPKLQMISTEALRRITVQSLYGLISFLCTRFNNLTPDQAMLRLQDAGAYLLLADGNMYIPPGEFVTHFQSVTLRCFRRAGVRPSDVKTGSAITVTASIDQAYAAAAAAAHHPYPDSQKELLLRACNLAKPAIELLQDGNNLSSEDVMFLSRLLPYASSTKDKEQPAADQLELKLYRSQYSLLCCKQKSFWNKHHRVCGMVKSALDMYCAQPGVPKYELHVICGVNEYVNGPRRLGQHFIHHCRSNLVERHYDHSHINFLAACKDDPQSRMVLFFAQCCNAAGATEGLLCCPVSVPPPDVEHVRCVYCEREGLKIVHPAVTTSFHGCGQDLVKVMTGEGLHGLRDWYTNNKIFEESCYENAVLGDLDDDSIYTTATCDYEAPTRDELFDDIC